MTPRRVHVGRVRVSGLAEAPAPEALAARIEAEVARAMSSGPPADPRAAIAAAVRTAAAGSASTGRPR